jgi:hypothetical protein
MPDIEQLHSLLAGFQELRKNPCYLQLEERLTAERTNAISVLVSGEFPPSDRDNAKGGDLQGILYREQLIGELRGLTRCSALLDSVINGLVDEVRRAQAENERPNETV